MPQLTVHVGQTDAVALMRACAATLRAAPAIAIGLLALCPATQSVAKVSAQTLATLAQKSDLIVIGTVSAIQDIDGVRAAEFEVERSLTSTSAPAKVLFRAAPTWGCDISSAKLGERALLFLSHGKEKTGENARHIYRLSFAGRGRMPEVLIEGRPHVNIEAEVVLPPELSRRGAESELYVLVPLDEVVAYVNEARQGRRGVPR